MKSEFHFCRGLLLWIGALSAALPAFAASDISVGPTGDETNLVNPDGAWQQDWGGVSTNTLLFDPSNAPPSGDVQGSVYLQGDWTGDTNGMDDYNIASAPASYFGNGATAPNFNGNDYQSIELDIKYDTNSTMTPTSGRYVEVGIDQWYSPTLLTNLLFDGSTPLSDGAWHHVSVAIPLGQPNVSLGKAVGFYAWEPAGTSGTSGFWVANVTLVARPTNSPPPFVKLSPTVGGLAQFADQGPTYDRNSVRTVDTANATWVGRPKPVSYSFTVAEFPNTNYPGFYLAMNLTTDPVPQNFADPDWSASDDVWVLISGQSNGTVIAGAYFKTNEPAGVSQFTPLQSAPGLMGPRLTNSSVLGTWTLKFTSDTNATLSAPGGASTSLSLPAAAAAKFSGRGVFWFGSGMGQGQNQNLGQHVTFSHAAVSGAATAFDSDLTSGALDTNLVLRSQHYPEGGPWVTNPPNQILVTGSDKYWLHWNLPDDGFVPASTAGLTGGAWNDLSSSPVFLNGSEHWIKIGQADVPGPGRGYFALIHRAYTQLQVLLPGETNAPNTLSGRTGTPGVVSLSTNNPVTVTINAVDGTWHVIDSVTSYYVGVTTTDPAGFSFGGKLSGGTGSANVSFGSTGSFTVTASDFEHQDIPPATSSPVTVGP